VLLLTPKLGASSYTKIAPALGKGLKKNDTSSRWHDKLKESSGFMEHKRIGPRGDINWTAEDNATIARMKAGGSSFSDIALALSKGHKTVHNSWRHYLKH
jgi:DNA-binding NarL/FixJ family response regulator